VTGFLTLSRALLLGYQRDRAALFFTILFPLIFLVLLGGLFGDDGTPRSKVVVVGAVDLFETLPAPERAQVEQVLAISRSQDLAAALAEVRAGDQAAAVVQEGTEVVVHYSAADAASAGAVRSVVHSLVQGANLAVTGQSPRFSMTASPVEDESLERIQYLTPGILGWAIATGATFGAASTLVVWRQRKLMSRLTLSPVGVPAVIGARVLVSLGVALAQTVLFVVVAVLFFDLRLAGSWWMSVPLVLAGTCAFLSIGLLAGAVTKSVEAASAVANLVVIPMAFLSGSFVPLDFAPQWLQTVSLVLPLRYLNDGMQDVLARGVGPVEVLPQLGILLAFALVVSVVATRLFRWEDA
jgi:ABC-2 type transport system permease protein